MGRDTKLTPELQEAFCEQLRNGSTFEMACRSLRITSSTFRLWRDKGRKQSKGVYSAFLAAIEEAEASCRAEAARQWKAAFPKDWRSAMEYLARRDPANFGNKSSQELTLGKGSPQQIEIIQIVKPPESPIEMVKPDEQEKAADEV